MNIAHHIERGAREYPERPALVFEGRDITYGECDKAASKTAGALMEAGVKLGDRVALFLPNVPEFAFAYLGALKLGAIAVSINANLKRDEVEFLLKDCGAKVVVATNELRQHLPSEALERVFVVGEDFEPALESASAVPEAVEMQPHDPAVIVYTSGTTGRPKGATLSHANVIHNIDAKRRYLGIRPADRALLFLPLYHCFGQNAVFNAMLQAGASVVLHRRFDFESVLESISTDGVTMFFGVPTTYVLLLDKVSAGAMGGVRYYFSAAAPLSVEIEERWAEKFGLPIFQGYGLTETSPFASYNHLEHYKPGSIGTPIEGVEMKVVNLETGLDASAGEKGEIVVRGHNVMLGYWNREADTAKAIRDGWFHTGDIGSLDDEGYFFIEDRLDDMINAGGVNVYPAEVENVLFAHGAVADAAVYGVPEALLGEQVCADVVLKAGSRVTEAELRAFCRQRLADVKAPTALRFVEEIPKGPTGKILKRVLREQAVAGGRAAERKERSVTKAEAEGWINDWLLANLDSQIELELHQAIAFADLGLDSILAVRLAKELSDWLGREVAITVAWNFPNTEALAEHLATRSSSGLGAEYDFALLSDADAEAALLAELQELNR